MEKTLTFSLSPKQLRYREILGKEFLEMEIYAISDINPNLNKTHFVTSGLEKFVERRGAVNKPILGFFEKNDFGSHDGFRDVDPETKTTFWNTERGERILGWVRESDPIELVMEDGLHWVKFNCVLCTKYCYKQVKRLLKDRSKKVSVEITVKEFEMIDGIEQIYDFDLNGVTILGSKNGRQVQEAIPGAHATVLQGLSDEAFAVQKEQIVLAYSLFEGEGSNITKEESNVDPNVNMTPESAACDPATEPTLATEPVIKNDCGGEKDHNEATAEGEPNDGACSTGEEQQGGEEGCAAEGEPAEGEPAAEPEAPDFAAQLEECRTALSASENHCSELQQQFDALFAESETLRARLVELEQIIEGRRRADLKVYAVQRIGDDKIAEADFEAITTKCEQGIYSCEEDVDKDIAYAVYKSRPNQGERLNAPIVTVGTTENQKIPMTRAERIAARNGNKK